MIELAYAGDLSDADKLAVRLSSAGLSPEASKSKARLFAKAAAALSVTGEAGRARAPIAFFVPGRIQFSGKHTDYAGGRTMVAAAEHGFCIAALPRDDRQMIVIDARSGETVRFHLDPALTPQTGSRSNYPMTVARRIARNFSGAGRGADIVFVSDLPPAAGMSSSSALMSGVFFVLSAVNQLPTRDEYWHNIGNTIDLAGYLGTVESGQSFGTLAGDRSSHAFGGCEDQTAILAAEPNHISQYAYCPVEFEKLLPVPPGHVFAVGSSGVAAKKTGASRERYQMPSRLAAVLAQLWRRETGRDDPHLAAALSSAADAAEQLKSLLQTVDTGPFDRAALAARLEHFMIESGEIIPQAGDALAGGDLRTLGRLVDRSQHAAERLLANQVPETVFLAASARRLGAVAATAFGAGFGGSDWALVDAAGANEFLAAWAGQYRAEFPQHAAVAGFFLTGAGPAAFHVC